MENLRRFDRDVMIVSLAKEHDVAHAQSSVGDHDDEPLGSAMS